MSRFLDSFRRPDSSAVLFQRGTAVLLVAVFIGLIFFRGGSLWWRYEEIVQDNRQKAEQFAHVLSEHLHQTIATIDATFTHLVAHSVQVGGPDAQPEQWNRVRKAAFSGLKAVDRISVVNRDGIVRHSTRPGIVRELRTDHSLFQLLAETMDVGLVATATYRDPETGRLLLPFARALTASTNEFDGIVAALFDPQLLREFYREIDLGDRTVISIISLDGEDLYRQGPAGAGGGREALQLSRLVGRPDLLVSDVIMGGDMNGRQSAERMRERWPDIKVLCISGYADGVLPQFVQGQTDSLHFAKPFRRRDLALKVREVLECENEQALFTV
jgi:CheY-like chemotaxis protein